MSDPITPAKALALLKKPLERSWTIQGFGMLRTYLDEGEVHRLHVWDPAAAFSEVSTIHDHPWDFQSRIISGRLRNQRYRRVDSDGQGAPFRGQYFTATIKTGEGGGLAGMTKRAWLRTEHPEHYSTGETYEQNASELHESFPSPGTVTVISRTLVQDRKSQVANVYWRDGDWITAEPRPATDDEVLRFAALAIERWEG